MKRHAEIAGGGIGGLGIGMMLAQSGWSVRIHERSPVLREIGSGISLRNNCITVLERHGTFARIEPLGSMLREELHYDAQGRFLQKRSLADQHRTLVIARQALVDGLAAAAREAGAEILTDSHIVGADKAGALIDSNGRRFQADLVVGADGVHSKVRPAVDARSTFQLLDTCVNRYLVDTRAFASEGQMFEHWSKDRRVGIMPGGPGRTYVYTVMPGNDEPACRMPLDVEDWTRAFPRLRDVFAVLSQHEGTQSVYPLVRCPKWSSERIALIGDAAHGMPPTLGQGAGLTLLNGHALTVVVSRMNDVPRALERWESSVRFISDTTQRWALRYDYFTRHWPSRLRPRVIWAFGRFKSLNRRMRLADLGLSLIEGESRVTSKPNARKRGRKASRRTGRPSKADAGVGREALIEAARRLLKSQPPAKLSRNQIAKFAGVNPTLIRYYFKDKSGLLTAVVETISKENLERLRQLMQRKGTAADKLRWRMKLMLQMHLENPYYHQLIFEQLWHGEGKTEKRLSREMVDPYFAEFRRIVGEGQSRGELRALDVRHLHVAVIGLSELFINAPYVMRHLFKTRDITPRLINEYSDFVSDILINGIGARVIANGRESSN